MPSSRGSSQPRDRTCVSCIGRQTLYHWATWEAPKGMGPAKLSEDAIRKLWQNTWTCVSSELRSWILMANIDAPCSQGKILNSNSSTSTIDRPSRWWRGSDSEQGNFWIDWHTSSLSTGLLVAGYNPLDRGNVLNSFFKILFKNIHLFSYVE